MTNAPAVLGIHHITAMAGDAQANVDFYARVLGLRLVKRTVNYDDPATYHLYFGDGTGTPGTLLTFFPWGAGSFRGRIGTGQVSVTSFAIPAASIGYLEGSLDATRYCGQRSDGSFRRTAVLALRDRDGIAARAGRERGRRTRGLVERRHSRGARDSRFPPRIAFAIGL